MAVCRLCLEAVDESRPSPGLLTDICACRGTQRHVHALCLEQWQLTCLERNEWWLARHCSVCRARLKSGLPWNAMWALGISALKGPLAESTLRVAAAPLPFWAMFAVFLPLWDAFGTGLLFALVMAAGSGFMAWQGFEATIVSVAIFALSWILLLAFPYVFRRHRRPSALWAVLLASNEPAEPFGRGAWWGDVEDGGLLRPPAIRSTGSSLALVNGSLLLLYGGWTSEEGPRNALWSADWQTVRATQRVDWRWVGVGPTHQRPAETYGQSFTLLGDDRFLVFGGHTLGGYRSPSREWRLLTLSPDAKSATWVSAGLAPLGAAWHSATLVGPGVAARFQEGFVFVFGGCGSSGAMRSVLVFDLSASRSNSSEAWHLNPEYILGEAPAPRSAHTATLTSDDRLWIVGGTNGDPMPWTGEDLDDGIWEFHAASLVWRGRHAIPGLRSPRQHTTVLVEGALVIYGGGTGGSNRLQVVSEVKAASPSVPPDFTVHQPQAAPLRGTMNLTVTGRLDTVPTAMEVASAEPPPLRGHCALWTGAEMVVFGGSTSESAWAEYSGMLVMKPV